MSKFVVTKADEKEVISIRIPAEMLKTVDRKAADNAVSRNELIVQMIDYCLKNMDETKSE